MSLRNLIQSRFRKKPVLPGNFKTHSVLKFLDTTRNIKLVDHFPKGTVSSDRSAIVGKRDWLFIFEGSNRYVAQYTHTSRRERIQKAIQWGRTIENRKRAVEKTGAVFFQLILPNKLSVYSRRAPQRIGKSMTPILRQLLRRSPEGLKCPLELFRKWARYGDIFRRNDSHLNFFGLFHLYQFVCDALSLQPDPTLFDMTMVQTVQTGDLGGKFDPNIRESLFAPDHTAFLERLNGRLVWKYDNSKTFRERGKHNGIQVVTECPSAKNPIRLLVFGNSFFDHPFSWGFSPFLSQSVREYHFIWSPCVDLSAVNEIQPDIVLAQTCERFLPKLPEDMIP